MGGIMRTVTVLAAGAVLLSAMPAVAQEWADLRNRLLERASELFAGEGYHPIGFTHEGALDDDESEPVSIPLGAGEDIVLVGICDGDCSDFDLTLFDPSGNQVSADLQIDDVPIIRTTPKSTGRYSVTVQMAECTIDPCRYAIQTFTN